MRTPIVLAILGFALWGTVTCRAQAAEEACVSCHDTGKKVQASAHAAVSCGSCHEKHETYPHPEGAPKPQCATCHSTAAGDHARSVHGMAAKKADAAAPDCSVCHGLAHELKSTRTPEFHRAVPETCGMCHSEVSQQFQASVHGKAVAKGNPLAPVCTSCHGEHQILSPKTDASTVSAGHIRETCAQCHGDVRLSKKVGLPNDRVLSFDSSFHGMAAKAGSQTVANCASCHSFHDILPSTDAKSSTNAKNLPATCGRCHPGAGKRFALGPIHLAEGAAEPKSVHWVRVAYSILIPLTIGFMLLHNLGDFLRKLAARRFSRHPRARKAAHAKPELRMMGFERVQHALLAISFLILVWTGFALKYPDQWWARPLVMWERSFPVRGTIHRISSVVFLIAGALHVISLIASRKLREHWKEMWPRRNDVPEAILNFGYNMGVVTKRPYRSHHSYVEKAEYWAVIWGGVIMGITGIMLWANNYMMAWLPKEYIDIATAVHLYEAVLATLAIVVWHFYSVIFDPDVYPLETAFLTGVSVKDQGEAEAVRAEPPPAPADPAPESELVK